MTMTLSPSPSLPALGRRGLEGYASYLVAALAPEAGHRPMAFPLAKVYGDLGLQVVEARLSSAAEIMASCLLTEGPVQVFGPAGPEARHFPAGTVLIDPRVRAYGLGAWRNSLAHELVHWIKDRPRLFGDGTRPTPPLCRVLDQGRRAGPPPSVLGRLEWEAHRLAPRVLMPWKPFGQALREALPGAKSCQGLLDDLAGLFQVSRASAALRIGELGYQPVLAHFADSGHFYPPSSPPRSYVPVSRPEAEALLARDPALRDRVRQGDVVFVFDGYFVKKDPAFLCRDGAGKLRVKSVAPDFLARCALNIRELPGRPYGWEDPATAWLMQRTQDHIDKRLLIYHPDFQADDFLDPEEAYEAVQRALSSLDEEEEKACLRIITDPDLTLCQTLARLMALQGWKYPRQFEEETRLHKNYFGRIQRDAYNNMGKDKLMALCVGLKLNLYLTVHLFRKAGYVLHRYQDPDRTYLKILEHAPGLPFDDFNGILRQSHLQELGTVNRF